MPKITYIETNGTEHTIEVKKGYSVMEGAVQNSLEGIVAECGGSCSCSTCHVYVDPAWLAKLKPQEQMEKDVLAYAYDVQSNSRLSCQIKVTEELEGLIVRMPVKQNV